MTKVMFRIDVNHDPAGHAMLLLHALNNAYERHYPVIGCQHLGCIPVPFRFYLEREGWTV